MVVKINSPITRRKSVVHAIEFIRFFCTSEYICYITEASSDQPAAEYDASIVYYSQVMCYAVCLKLTRSYCVEFHTHTKRIKINSVVPQRNTL